MTYGYDEAGRRTSQVSPSDSVTTTYDGFGRKIEESSSTATIRFGYNDASQVTSEVTTGAGLPQMAFQYTHCGCGAVTSVTGPGGTTSYGYNDASGILTSVTDPSGAAFDYSHDSAGRVTGMTRPNGIDEATAWSPDGEIASLTQVDAATGSDVGHVSYTYDDLARTTSRTDASGTTTFGYDGHGNLDQADLPAGSPLPDETFTYDQAGNRVAWDGNPATSVVVDAANRLKRDAQDDYAYDGEGDLLSRTVRGTGASTHYRWASGHLLTGVTRPDGSKVSYAYDPEGRKVLVTHPDGSATVFGYDGMHVAAVWDMSAAGTAHLRATYVTDPLGAPLVRTTAGGDRAYAVLDALGSVVGTLDQSGHETSTTAYSAFGQPHTSSWSGDVGLDGVYGYTGYAWDAETGQYDARARWYQPDLGRFTSEDPVTAPNLYWYVGNQPLDFTDPTGEIPSARDVARVLTECVLVFGSIIGVGQSEAANTLGGEPATSYVEDCEKRREADEELEAAEEVTETYEDAVGEALEAGIETEGFDL
jgi:RHS repeat-associated protein